MHCDVGRHLPVSPVGLIVQTPPLGPPEGGVLGVLGMQHFLSSVSFLQRCRGYLVLMLTCTLLGSLGQYPGVATPLH